MAAGAHAAVPTAADLARAVRLVFGGIPAAAGGDVNADGLATAADVCGTLLGMRNPSQGGPYGVGFRRLTFTKESVTVPGQLRQLDTRIWYPADPVTAPLDMFERGKPNAPLAEGANHLPLLLFSHGSCGIPDQSHFLTTTLASYGFIVAAPPHPGNTTGDFATCAQDIADSAVNRPADISFVIDQFLALNDTADSFFFGAVDAERIGVTGHSFGGYTALRVCALDPRVVAGLPLAPAFFGIENEVASIKVPMMIQGGDIDTLTPFSETSQPAYDLLGPPRYLVEILHIGHYAFSDLCVAAPDCGTPEDLTQEEAHWASLRYAVPFLLHYVAGDDRFDAFLAPHAAPPGIVFTADTGSG
jgi:predicted dienelactone hydrolase